MIGAGIDGREYSCTTEKRLQLGESADVANLFSWCLWDVSARMLVWPLENCVLPYVDDVLVAYEKYLKRSAEKWLTSRECFNFSNRVST